MIQIEKLDTKNKAHVKRFIEVPFPIFKDTPQWVPPIRADVALAMDRDKHPYYEHSEADFFIATRDGQDVGRIATLHNRHYNEYHGYKRAQFYYFECQDDPEAANALFNRAFEWAKERGLDTIIGPKGFAALDGYGMLVDGFDQRQMMTMMNYNHPYQVRFVEDLGFEKEVDFVSDYLKAENIQLPDRVRSIAERIQKRGVLQVQRFSNKSDLRAWANRIGSSYNKTFVNNWEYVPLTDKEIKLVLDNILVIADPKLIKIISHDDQVVGFLLGFKDVSEGIQRSQGNLYPFGIFHILMDMRRTRWMCVNGAGILPEFQGRGGNALLYAEMEKTIKDTGYDFLEMTQVAESAVQMRCDLENLGGIPYKNHRVYRKAL